MALLSCGWRISCDLQDITTTNVKSLLCWDTRCCLTRAEKLIVIKKRPALLRWNLQESVSWDYVGAVFHRQPRLYFKLAPELGSVRVTQVVLVLKVMENSSGLALWGAKRGPLLKIQPQWPLKAQDWRDHRENERTYEKLVVKVWPSFNRGPQHVEDASSIGWPRRTVAVVEWSQPRPRRQTVCTAEAGAEEVTRASWRNPGDGE